MRRPTPNAIVGLAMLVAFVLFLGFTFAIRGSLFGGGQKVDVMFERVSGLEVGAPVYVAGVYAGEVTQISYRPEHLGKPVVVTLGLHRNILFHRGTKVSIVQSGLIGDRRIEIDPGSPEEPPLPSGEPVEGEPQFDIDRSLREGQQIVSDLAASIRSLRDFMTDEANVVAIRNSLQNAEKTFKALDEGISNANAILVENREDFRAAVQNIRDASERSSRLLDRAEQLVGNADTAVADTQRSINTSLQDIHDQIARVGDSLTTMGQQIAWTAEDTRAVLRDTLTRLDPMLENLDRASAEMADILTRVREGRGTLGQLINNPEPFREIERTARAIRRTFLGRTGIESTIRYEDLGAEPPPTPPATPAPGASPAPNGKP